VPGEETSSWPGRALGGGQRHCTLSLTLPPRAVLWLTLPPRADHSFHEETLLRLPSRGERLEVAQRPPRQTDRQTDRQKGWEREAPTDGQTTVVIMVPDKISKYAFKENS
jgi:hypothetical protein